MKYATVPVFLRYFYPSLLWNKPEGNKRLYLTFDDGPHPVITPIVLKILDEYQAQATFFCVGENVVRHPATYKEILAQGHLTGNHSFNHLNGWKTDNAAYYENVRLCADYVDSIWFRPPYGRIRPMQIQSLKKEFTIVMWTVLSYDFDPEIDLNSCMDKVLNNTTDGSIIVFHDSEKAVAKMIPLLKKTLETFGKQGFSFARLDD
ncbi:MAG: polysaccharide deacetylase family protein [Bacteroidales bacterium]|jgi:peptidoglycan/xylan/chitin deacetylase (PgdA/CDA1 family)|nr:polysaccharide deacetylase family protein [Bacteroidales bacterium]MCK9449620.1 polysaccharide deacetylase family protein [Bacteroidales bacterium]MDD3702260.1 polysaccharide deacetylase family protein [Bacteroidales bacterium]MDY0368865.1 polysaccharide deacetylase family protein [Bacteroidales bacterium]